VNDRAGYRIGLNGDTTSRYLIGKRLRLVIRGNPQLASQGLSATLVLSKCFSSPSCARICPDQRSLADLGQRVEQHQPAGGLDGCIVLASRFSRRGQAVQGVAGNHEGAVTLGRQPLLKRLGGNMEIGKKFSPI
jgi:hypothetical protein